MKINLFHWWDVTPQEAIRLQEQLRALVIPQGHVPKPKLVAGSDAAFGMETGRVFVGTRDRVRPIFVSVGYRFGLAQAVQLTLACGKGYRIPEPTRQAGLLAERAKREAIGIR
jgi:deoxyribonuclease V